MISDKKDLNTISDPFLVICRGNIEEVLHMLNSTEKLNINKIRHWSGFSMLHRAAQLGNTDICEILIKFGADVNMRSVRGWYTPLHLALANGYIETAIFLMNAGAKPWTKSKYKEDPFTYGMYYYIVIFNLRMILSYHNNLYDD